MTPGQITITSAGTFPGPVFRPTMRVYYEHARHGVLFEEVVKPLRCRSRKRAIEVGREWRKSDDGLEALRDLFARIAASSENTIPEFNDDH